MTAAQVRLSAIGRETTTDARGHFRMEGVPAGRYAMTIRAIGFAPIEDSIVITAARTLSREYVMVGQLDTVSVVAAQASRSVAEKKLAERRSTGVGQHIAEETLRKQTGRSLAQVILRHFTGLRAVSNGSGTYFASSRQVGGRAGQTRRNCYVSVYLDGSVLYDGSTGAVLAPDFERWEAHDFSSIEFYSASTAPPEFKQTFSGCGVLVLRSREG